MRENFICAPFKLFVHEIWYLYTYIYNIILSYYYNKATAFVYMLPKISESTEQIIMKF